MSTEQKQQERGRPKAGLRALFPGRKVDVLDDDGNVLTEATVYPLGARHIETASRDVAAVGMLILEALKVKVDDANGHVRVDQGAISPEKIISAAVPALLKNGFSLLRECIKIDIGSDDEIALDDLPHWCLPPLVEAFVEESFGSKKKWEPWKRLIENMVRRFSKNPEFSISETFSRLSSQTDTTTTGSSTDANQDSR